MDRSIVKEGKSLRYGYTTGTCAAGTAQAAARMCLTTGPVDEVIVDTPRGWPLRLPVIPIDRGADWASCAIRKDSGDDPDVTDGMLIVAKVSLTAAEEITVTGGPGIGRVTLPGLKVPVGEAAINPVPRRMIEDNVREAARRCGYTGGFAVTISAPGGEAVARQTFNPRLGIEGGISILGTSGIVEPMSEDALRDSLALELDMLRAGGYERVLFCPGNYGWDFAGDVLGLSMDRAVKIGNFVGDMLDAAGEKGFSSVLLVAHIGKAVKLAAGMMNTHSRYGDCRMEILAAQGIKAGIELQDARAILDCATTDAAVDILYRSHCHEAVFSGLVQSIEGHMARRAAGALAAGAMIFNHPRGLLATGKGAATLMEAYRQPICKEDINP